MGFLDTGKLTVQDEQSALYVLSVTVNDKTYLLKYWEFREIIQL